MKKTLGIDLGTNSLGWAVTERKLRKTGTEKIEEIRPMIWNGREASGVVVFPEGVKNEKGNEKSRAAERTGYRSARKLKFRRKLRKYETLKVLIKNSMCPLSIEELKRWRDSGFNLYPNSEAFLKWLRTSEEGMKNPYYFRDKFSRKRYDWRNDRSIGYELGRAFYHMAQRRGFKSNRLDQSDEGLLEKLRNDVVLAAKESSEIEELKKRISEIFSVFEIDGKLAKDLNETEKTIKKIDRKIKTLWKQTETIDQAREAVLNVIHDRQNLGKVEQAIQDLNEKMQKTGAETLGQYFWMLYEKDRTDAKNKIRNHYTHREKHYEDEFRRIAEVQQLPTELTNELKRAIFYQRPLKSQKGLVGNCTLEPDKARCPISRPEFEEFRMHQLLSSIRIAPNDDEPITWRRLSSEERQALIPRFYLKRKHFPFSDLLKALSEYLSTKSDKKINISHRKSSDAKNADYLVNYFPDQNINGNPVSAELKGILGPEWKEKKYEYKEEKYGNVKTHRVGYEDIWHVLFTFEDKEHLYRYAKEKLCLDEKEARRFSRINLPSGYANLSLKAIRKILPFLSRGLVYSHAVFMANIHKTVKKEVWNDPQKRKDIEEGIGLEIERHGRLTRALQAGNAFISESINKNYSYAPESENELKKDLESQFIKVFGSYTWFSLSDKDWIWDLVWEKVINELKKAPVHRSYLKIPRLDEQISEFLSSNDFLSGENAMRHLYHPSDLQKFKSIEKRIETGEGPRNIFLLPDPKSNSIKNPVLMRAMYQLRKLINTLLEKGLIDNDTHIQIEMAREVNDANKRAAYRKWQLRQQNENQQIEEILQELFREAGKSGEVMPDDIVKAKLWTEQVRDKNGEMPDLFVSSDLISRYKLWKEQKGRCLYTGNTISITQLFDGTSFDIEHTIPRSRSWDNSLKNKTIASAKFNRDVKKNKTPYELMEEKKLQRDDLESRLRPWKDKIEKLRKEINKIQTGGIQDKEVKDRKIQKRHLLKMELDYWQGKYERFFMKEINNSFKNSQITDTGLITRFAREYIGCAFKRKNGFPNVSVVNGTAVSEFRKAWGLQSYYQKKSRINHVHHAIDAMVIASITRDKYDAFARIWRQEEEYDEKSDKLREQMRKTKPWPNFTEDLLRLEEKLPVVHRYKDNLPVQNRKKLRKRGKIQYIKREQLPAYMADKKEGKDYFIIEEDGKRLFKIPIYQQGDTVRGSLHLESFYGAIAHNSKGEVMYDDKNNIIPQFVIRKALDSLKDGEVKKIVDPRIREIVQHDRNEEKRLKKEMKRLNKRLKPETNEADEAEIVEKISELEAQRKRLYHISPRAGKNKRTPIRKVRIYAHINNDLPGFKKHADPFLSKKEYKQNLHVANDENYCMVIYEGIDSKNAIRREFILISNFEAGQYYRLSNRDYRKLHPISPNELIVGKSVLKKKYLLKKGDMVLFYKNNAEELRELPIIELSKRLYKIIGFEADGRVQFRHHSTAMQQSSSNKDELTIVRYMKECGIKNSVVNYMSPTPWLRLSRNKLNFLLENMDFEIHDDGQINFKN